MGATGRAIVLAGAYGKTVCRFSFVSSQRGKGSVRSGPAYRSRSREVGRFS